jgi:hypothetical protein
MKRLFVTAFAFFLLVFVSRNASAHKPSDSYVTLEVAGTTIDGRWDIALRDLDYAIGVDKDGNGEITWGEVLASTPAIETYAFSHFAIHEGESACPITPNASPEIALHSDGSYITVRFRAACPKAATVLDVDYHAFFDLDPQHHGLLHLVASGATRTAIFTSKEQTQRFDLGSSGESASFASVVRDGIRHIWTGLDHMLFLLALLLPSVLRREGDRDHEHWVPVATFRLALTDVLKIVTAFTIAHSITLSLATLGIVRLPARLVESGIAASVVFVAVNNVVPMLRGDRWSAAFALGLLHGFGFSAVLVDLGLPRAELARTLFGFNVGVEIGQLAFVAIVLPVVFLLRRSIFYRRVGLVGGSIAITVLASVWLVERAFQISLIS